MTGAHPLSGTDQPGDREIVIRHGSRMANRALQLLAAVALSQRVPGYRIAGYDIPEWGLCGPRPNPGFRAIPKVTHQRFDPDLLAGLMASGELPRLMLRNPCCNIKALPDRATAAAVFTAPDTAHTVLDDGEILFHIRLEDILIPGRHTRYGPLPLNYYAEIAAATRKRPVFIGQLGTDRYSAALKARFPEARFLEGGSVLHDFQTLRHAPHLGIAVSSFSWLAGWLGTAQTIHYPLSGMLHPDLTPEVDLIPRRDARYRFYWLEPETWHAGDADFEALFHSGGATRLSSAALDAIQARSTGTVAAQNTEWAQGFRAQLEQGAARPT